MATLFSILSISGGIAAVFKIAILVLEVLYVLFAFIIIRQVALLNDSFNTSYKGFFNVLALLHFFVSVALLVFSYMLFK